MSELCGSKYTFEWIIEMFEFSMLMYFDSKEIRSPLFTTTHLGEASWFLTIRAKVDLSMCLGPTKVFYCSLVRDSEDTGIDTLQIHWKLKVASSNDRFKVFWQKDASVINTFGKGDSCLGCKLIEKSSVNHQTTTFSLTCQMTDYSSLGKPVSKSSAILSKVSKIFWKPQSLLEIKLFSGAKDILYEVYFYITDDRISINLCRSDGNKLIECYNVCSLCADYLMVNVINNPHSKGRDRLRKPFKINDVLEIPTTLRTYEFPRFKVRSEFKIYGWLITSVPDVCTEKPETKVNLTLSDNSDIFRDLQQIYESRKHTDMKLQVGRETFSVHKCILSSRSPVFSAMFDQDMVENNSGVVIIDDIDTNTISLLLKYIYTNAFDEMHCKNALELMLAADKYQISSLKEKCSVYLWANISEENVCEVLAAADLISDQNLKSTAMDYVKARADKILLSDNWKLLVARNANLVADTLRKISIDFGNSSNEIYAKF